MKTAKFAMMFAGVFALAACGDSSDETLPGDLDANGEAFQLNDPEYSAEYGEDGAGAAAESADQSDGYGQSDSELSITSGSDNGETGEQSDTMIRGESADALDENASKLQEMDPVEAQ